MMVKPFHLEGDTANAAFLDDWLEVRSDGPEAAALTDIVRRIAGVAGPLAARLALARIPGDPGRIVGNNSAGDAQKTIDIAAHGHFLAALEGASVTAVLSEEAPRIIPINREGRFAVAIEPIDGSGNIGIGAPLGTLFAVFPAEDRGAAFRLSGRSVRAAGYLSFGPSVDLGLSLGDGVCLAALDPRDGRFRITDDGIKIAHGARTIAFNASNERHWPKGLQRYAEELRAGKDGPRGRDLNMRWLAAAVGELHRILRRGGAFLYPADRRPGYGEGRLRLLYEAVPIAFLIEQADGAATDGRRPILDMIPRDPHQNVPLYFGAREEVARIGKYLAGP